MRKAALWAWGAFGVGCYALALLLPADAADLRPPPAVVAKAPVVTPWTWSGLWVGVNAGAALSKSDVDSVALAKLGLPSNGSFHNNGLLLGGELDARYQAVGSSLVFGIDAIVDWANTKGGDGGCLATVVSCNVKNSLFGFFGAEIGLTSVGGQTAAPYNPLKLSSLALPLGNAEIAALGGVAVRHFEMTTSIPIAGPITSNKEAHTVIGPAVGAALNIAPTPNLSFGIRYIHPFWKDNSCAGAITATLGAKGGIDCTLKSNEDIFLANVSYKLPVLGN